MPRKPDCDSKVRGPVTCRSETRRNAQVLLVHLIDFNSSRSAPDDDQRRCSAAKIRDMNRHTAVQRFQQQYFFV